MGPRERQAYLEGRQRFDAGDEDGALEAFGALVELCPRFADIHYMMGIVHERQGRLPEAAASLERALDINPDYTECIVALVSVYEQQGQFDRSRALTERLADAGQPALGLADPTTANKLANLQASLGDALHEAGELREAIEAYRRALDRAPAFHDVRYRLGISLREAGLPSQAIAEFNRVLRGNPSFHEAAIQLGLTWYTLGRSDRAVEQWRAVAEQDPTRNDAQMYLRMVGAEADAPTDED